MLVVILQDNTALMVLQSASLRAEIHESGRYSLIGDTLSFYDVDDSQLIVLPNDVSIHEGDVITEDIKEMVIHLDYFLQSSPEEAVADALGLVLRTAVELDAVSDEELLRIKPALENRKRKTGLAAAVGDVYAFHNDLWRCIQAHATRSDWTPDTVPALWHKVQKQIEQGDPVWQSQTAYATGDIVRYPDETGTRYTCLQGHTSQVGWEPPNVPALWETV